MKKTKPIDALGWMKTHFAATPPEAIRAFNQANIQRDKIVAGGKTVIPLPLPYAPPRDAAADLRAQLSATPKPIPPHFAATLRSGVDADRLRDCQMELRAGLAKFSANVDREAEAHLKHRTLKPLAIGTTTTGSTGGYTVPSSTLEGVLLERLIPAGFTRQVASIFPVSHGQVAIPYVDAAPQVFYPAEIETLDPSDIVVGSLGASVRKRTVLSRISNELLADSGVAYMDAWLRVTSNAMASVLDAEVVNGDGSDDFGGVSGLLEQLGAGGVVDAASGNDSFATLDAADFANLLAALPSKYWTPQAAWLCSPAFYGAAMLRAAGAAAQSVDAAGRLNFMGRPVYFSNEMPTVSAPEQVSVLFGDLSTAITIADRGVRFAASDLGPASFETGTTVLRVVHRYDAIISLPGDETDAGCYVGLATAAS